MMCGKYLKNMQIQMKSSFCKMYNYNVITAQKTVFYLWFDGNTKCGIYIKNTCKYYEILFDCHQQLQIWQ